MFLTFVFIRGLGAAMASATGLSGWFELPSPITVPIRWEGYGQIAKIRQAQTRKSDCREKQPAIEAGSALPLQQ